MTKETLRHLFDDSVCHTGWQLAVRRAIVALIAISGLMSFVETFGDFAMRWQRVLFAADCIIIAVFSVEVALRIWVGGRRYVFSFYGMVDIVSTYPFYLALIFPIPYSALRILRVLRLMRVFRYMRASHILARAFASKKAEMSVSLQFLVIITFVLSIMLYHVEHSAQPEIYSDGFTSVAWAFAQYIGDPGGFADYAPITFGGKLIATVVGILGIAIFAVPAGIIGSAFVEVMDEERKADADNENIEKIRTSFRRLQCRDTLMQHVPESVDFLTIQAEKQLSEQEIVDAVNAASDLRMRNAASTYPRGYDAVPRLVVEHFPSNNEYGNCIDRGSNVTIVATSCYAEAGLGWFSYYLALFGGFNYVSKEFEPHPLAPRSYYMVRDTEGYVDAPMRKFIDDIERLAAKAPDRPYVIFILSANGGMEPETPSRFHFTIGAQKGDETYDDTENLTIKDIPRFAAMYDELTAMLASDYGLESDRHRHHGTNKRHLPVLLDPRSERFTMRIAWEVTTRHPHRLEILWKMATILHRHFDPARPMPEQSQFKTKAIGYYY